MQLALAMQLSLAEQDNFEQHEIDLDYEVIHKSLSDHV
jgi:hypothetical protein